MTSIDDRPDTSCRRVSGAWEGDLIIGKEANTAAATLVERTSRFTVIRALPQGKNADDLAGELNNRPRAYLRYYTPREVFQKVLLGP